MKKINTFIVGCLAALCLSSCTIASSYDHAYNYSSGNFDYRAADVKNVNVNWVKGNVTIVETNADVLSVKETDYIANSEYRVHYCFDGNTLDIQFCNSGIWGITDLSKDIVIEVPSLENLKVDVVSANVDIRNCTSEALDIDSVSGSISAELNAGCLDVDIDTVSGCAALKIDETIRTKVDYSSVSGSYKNDHSTTEKPVSVVDIEFDSVSGDLRIE